MKRVQIVPAILVKNYKQFETKIRLAEKYFSLVQIDIADNKFVKNKTFYNFEKIKQLKTTLNYELHLMVKKPAVLINKWKKFNKVKRIIIHFESINQQELQILIREIKLAKKQVGLAINPETSVMKITDFLNQVDLILIMGVHPGWTGQTFQPNTYAKIRLLRKLNSKINIAVDGGVNDIRASKLIKAGANILCSGSYLFNIGLKKAKRLLLINNHTNFA